METHLLNIKRKTASFVPSAIDSTHTHITTQVHNTTHDHAQVTPVYSADLLSEGSPGGRTNPSKGDRSNNADDNDTDPRAHALAGQPIADAVASRLPKLHSLLLGPGMGRHPTVTAAAAGMVSRAREVGLPVVLDADAIAMVVADPAAVRGFRLAVLTPNANEFRQLCERMEGDGDGDCDCDGDRREKGPSLGGDTGRIGAKKQREEGLQSPPPSGAAGEGRSTAAPASRPRPRGPPPEKALQVERLATYLGGATVVLKGKVDIISDGSRTVACEVPGGLKRCGGIGDVLSGAMATALAWVNLQNFEGEEASFWVSGGISGGGGGCVILGCFAFSVLGASRGYAPHIDARGLCPLSTQRGCLDEQRGRAE